MIISLQNEQFKNWMKLKQKKYRDSEGLFLVYGKHLVDEAVKAKCIKEIITTNEQQQGTLISKALMHKLSETQTDYDICAVCYKKQKAVQSDKILLLEDIQDPDNVGALLRSALAFGFNHVVLSSNSADLYNEKVIRTSKGAFFHLFVERTNALEAVKKFKEMQYKIYTTAMHGETSYAKENRVVLVLGNEGKGITKDMFNEADTLIAIKTNKVESLNVSVAGAIFMYEWSK